MNDMFKVPEQYRVRAGYMRSTEEQGNNGVFKIVEGFRNEIQIICIASDAQGWENVSIAVKKNNRHISPTLGQIKKVKELFWDNQACVAQFYGPQFEGTEKGEKIVHLWRKEGENYTLPILKEN